MKIIKEPSVYLITRQTVDRYNLEAFLSDNEFDNWNYSGRDHDADFIPEIAGRLCYLSFGTGRTNNKQYLDNILNSAHGSVLEHTVFGFIWTGISRTLTHELVRHRAGMAFSQLSQRYVDESKANFVMPPKIIGHAFEEERWKLEVTEDLNNYIARVERMMEWPEFQLVENKTERRKQVREAARSNLPNATETMIFVTGNNRAWRNMLELRFSGHAEAEYRRIMNKVYDILAKESPNCFGDYTKIALPDGSYEVTTEHRKV